MSRICAEIDEQVTVFRTRRLDHLAFPYVFVDATVDVEKVSGVVELPLHIRWSGPPRRYDLADRQQRARVYEQVLREGNEGDIRRFISVDQLIDMWDELVLPRHVRQAWADWLGRKRGGSLSC